MKLSCALSSGTPKGVVAAALGLAVRAAGLLIVVVAAPAFEVGVALALLQALAGLGDGRQARLAPSDLGRDVQLGLVLLGLVGLLCALEQGLDLRLQLGLGLEHVAVAHGLVAARVGLDLGAVDRDRAQLDQAHLARQPHHLHEQLRQLLQVQGPEVADRAVRREVARRQHPEGHVLVELPGDLARAEHARGVAVDQHLDHHRRVKRLVARPVLVVAGVERAQIERVDRVADEVRQVPLGQPVLDRLGQQQHLLRFVREVVRGHGRQTYLIPQSQSGTSLLPPRLLARRT